MAISLYSKLSVSIFSNQGITPISCAACKESLRYLLLALLAFVLAFVSRPAPPPGEHLAWNRAAQHAAATFLPVVLTLVLLAEVEKRRALLEQLGMRIHIRRFQPSTHNCKI